jgi:tRNA (cytidine/uridine-2'-O-)-methyltransferase
MNSKYPRTLMNIVLVEPEIPNNTGNIGRTCVGLWSKLHVVGPLGFTIDDKQLKRAGLDYWPNLDWALYKDWQEFRPQLPPDRSRIFVLETGSNKSLYDVRFQPGDWLLFGKETVGFSKEIRQEYQDRVYSLPFPGKIRSFNLANCVSMSMSRAFSQFIESEPELGRVTPC